MHTGILEIRAAQNNRCAVGQRFANGFKRLSSHDDDVSRGHFFEPLEILRQMPRNFVPVSDHAIFAHRGYGFEIHVGVQALACRRSVARTTAKTS